MFSKYLFALIVILFSGSALAQSEDASTLLWKGTPVYLDAKPGGYVMVVFDEEVVVDVPTSIAPMLNVLMTRPGYVVLNPVKAFDTATIQISRKDGAATYLVNLKSSPSGIEGTFTWLDALHQVSKPEIPEMTEQSSSDTSNLSLPPQIALTRHAAQTLYAPARLIPLNDDITRVPVSDFPEGIRLMRTPNGEELSYEVHGSWRGYGYFVTAIVIRNLSEVVVELDPRKVHFGSFTGVSFQHNKLSPVGTHNDHTTLYLTSYSPFDIAIWEQRYVLQ